MRDNVKVIIAKYREDVSWADALGYDYIVYDKGGDCDDKSFELDNIGRESHTYLTHIVNEYDALSPLNVFLQGNPFDHLDEQGRGSVEMLRNAIEMVAEKGTPFKGLAWLKIACDGLGRPHHLHEPENKGRWSGWGKDIPVGEVFTLLFGAKAPEKIIARGSAGIFAVTADRIRTRPKAFYEYALRLIEADPHDEGNTGHAFERLWHYIFNGNTAWNRDRYPGESK